MENIIATILLFSIALNILFLKVILRLRSINKEDVKYKEYFKELLRYLQQPPVVLYNNILTLHSQSSYF